MARSNETYDKLRKRQEWHNVLGMGKVCNFPIKTSHMTTFPTVVPPTMAWPPWMNSTGVGQESPTSCSHDRIKSPVSKARMSKPVSRLEIATYAPSSEMLALPLLNGERMAERDHGRERTFFPVAAGLSGLTALNNRCAPVLLPSSLLFHRGQ